MKLGVIKSFLVVCFTMVQKYLGRKKFTKFLTKISRNGYKTIFREKMYYIYNIYKRKFYNNLPAVSID